MLPIIIDVCIDMLTCIYTFFLFCTKCFVVNLVVYRIYMLSLEKRDPHLQEWTKIGIFTFYSFLGFFIENFPIKLILLAYMYLSVILAEFEQLAFIGPDIVVIPLFAPIFDCICYVVTLCTKNKQHTVNEKQNLQ